MPAPLPEPKPRAARVLVVEDEPFVRLALADALRGAGLKVVEAASADEALAYLEASILAGVGIDLVFSDIQMPGSLDGLGLARHLRRERPALPVVLTSGNALPPGGPERFAFVAKPYSHQQAVAVALAALALATPELTIPEPGAPGAEAIDMGPGPETREEE